MQKITGKDVLKATEQNLAQVMMDQLKPYQRSVIAERYDLNEKIAKLAKFEGSPQFRDLPVEEQEMLFRQRKHMTDYWHVLGERIDYFYNQLKQKTRQK